MADVNDGVTGDNTEVVSPGSAGAKPAFGGFIVLEDEEEPRDQAEHARLLELYASSFKNITEGEVIKGTVLKVSDSEVVVDVGYKSEGVIALSEFYDETGEAPIHPGDLVDVLLERTEDREGHIVLSREKAEKMKIWDDVEKAYADRKVVIGLSLIHI